MALIDKQPRSAMARSVDEAVVKEIDKDALLGFLKNSPSNCFQHDATTCKLCKKC